MDYDMLIVKTEVLPDVFQKVVEAKRMIASKKAKSASEAARMCGISRSAFYKYRDAVFSYERTQGMVINLSAVLEDKAGVLSMFISVLHDMQANILTINQGMPSGGIAQVTVSYRDESDGREVEAMLKRLLEIEGVISLNQVIGE